MRVFVAVFPPPELREEVLAKARRLSLRGRVRWSRPENVHLTLKFLGDVREEVLTGLCAALEVCERHAAFDARLAGFGAFPSARRAQILWAGIGVGSDELRSLATDLDAALAPLGFEREKRPYTPHLTLGRARGQPASFEPPPEEYLGEFRVRRVELMESTLTPEGAIYRTVRAFALKEKS
ncbi:MAG: RNA 2',3'-cyclic phosphodiesterase [Actinomycetota bacterium]|nr:RNA 2',3'-cyclic phosphodiesterase [Actinomycetota bacterium]